MEPIVSISRPNFFPGQLIDYRDFNRLSSQADRVTALLCRYLFEGGGIIVNALSDFRVVPLEGLTCLVKPGIGLLPNGQALVMSNDLAIDLAEYWSSHESRRLIVSLRNQVHGKDRFTDQEDTSIVGYRSEVFEPELTLSAEPIGEDSIELFRVELDPNVTQLRLGTEAEEWQEKLPAGVIDMRFRNQIVPQTFVPLNTQGLIALRKALYGIEEAHSKLGKIYLVEDPFYTVQYLTQLHAEVLTRPFQPLKVGFLIAEVSEKLSLFLERVSDAVGQTRSNFDRETLHRVVQVLDRLKVKEVLPRRLDLHAMVEVSTELQRMVDFAERKFSLVNTISEAFVDIRNREVALEDKLVLAGHLFQRVDRVDTEKETHLHVQGQDQFRRVVSAKFENGDALSLKGAFLRDGMFSVDFQCPESDKPAILLLHQYIRRGGCRIHYEVNGKHLTTDLSESFKESNSWVNRGLVVPAEFLVPKQNQLRIRIEKSDLDFGFFDLAVYQPVVYRGSEK